MRGGTSCALSYGEEDQATVLDIHDEDQESEEELELHGGAVVKNAGEDGVKIVRQEVDEEDEIMYRKCSCFCFHFICHAS